MKKCDFCILSGTGSAVIIIRITGGAGRLSSVPMDIFQFQTDQINVNKIKWISQNYYERRNNEEMRSPEDDAENAHGHCFVYTPVYTSV